ncbi:tail fiber protein [Caudoviricetes sp.]|nr:tail fiber protein [Caudoviricetes sp.]
MSGQINVDVIQTSAGPSLGAGNASIMKNRIINGAMVIDQRNAGASVTPASGASTYLVDRWRIYASQASKLTAQQNAGSVTPPVGFTKYEGITSSSAYSITSTDIFTFNQQIEGFNISDLAWGTANAKTVTLSFQVYSSLTGTFGGALKNLASTQSYPFTYSIPVANTWTTISITIAGSTSGVWNTDNTTGIGVFFGLGVGSTYSGTAGSWASGEYYSATGATSVVGTNGATFYITGVQLEVGSSATGFEYRYYGHELALCQRYYEQFNITGGAGYGTGGSTISGQCRVMIPFLVQKRTTPSFSYSGNSGFQVQTNNTNNSVTGISQSGGSFGQASYLFASTSITIGYAGTLIDSGGSGSYLAFSAEL